MLVYGDFTTTLTRALEEIDPSWMDYRGLIIAGTHNPNLDEIDFLLDEIRIAREEKIPFLGICYGHQLCAIEYARDVLGIKDATSEEFGQGTYVVKKLPELNVGLKDGETYWNNYYVDIDFDNPPHFFTTQAHPEYQSFKDKPHPLLVSFLNLCKK